MVWLKCEPRYINAKAVGHFTVYSLSDFPRVTQRNQKYSSVSLHGNAMQTYKRTKMPFDKKYMKQTLQQTYLIVKC